MWNTFIFFESHLPLGGDQKTPWVGLLLDSGSGIQFEKWERVYPWSRLRQRIKNSLAYQWRRSDSEKDTQTVFLNLLPFEMRTIYNCCTLNTWIDFLVHMTLAIFSTMSRIKGIKCNRKFDLWNKLPQLFFLHVENSPRLTIFKGQELLI